jgi:hypothetical protein
VHADRHTPSARNASRKVRFTVRNLQTGAVVSGVASSSGSFSAVVPVSTTMEQHLELTIKLKDKTGIETTITRSLGLVAFASAGTSASDRGITYHYVEPAGRGLIPISANVRGRTVGSATRKTLPRPEVAVSYLLNAGAPEHGTSFNFTRSTMRTALELKNVSADTIVLVQQQVPPQADGKPRWEDLSQAQVASAQTARGSHELSLERGVLGHTPLRILIRRPGEKKTHVAYAAMPPAGNKPVGSYTDAVSRIYRQRYANWLRPETVRRTVAYRGEGGFSFVRAHGKQTAPATAIINLVNETTQAVSAAEMMRNAFTATVRAMPGDKLALKVTYADGKVESKPLGIVPDAVDPSYQPQTGLAYFPFTQNYVK